MDLSPTPPTPPPSPPPCSFDLTLSQFLSLPVYDPRRTQFLVNLIASLHSSELSYLHTSLQDSPRLKRDFLRDLPRELSLHIASYLAANDLVKLGQVSREWQEIMLNEGLWRDLARSGTMGATLDKMAGWRLKTCDPTQDGFSYRKFFAETGTIKREWEEEGGGCPIRIHNSPDAATITAMAISSEYAIVALNSASVHIFSIRTGRLLRTLSTPQQMNGREGTWAVNLVLGMRDGRGVDKWSASRNTAPGWGTLDSLVVTGGCERALRVWELETGRCLQVLHGHRATVRCLVTLPGKPISVTGSRDTTIRVWNIAAGRLIHTLRGHNDAVRCLDTPSCPPAEGEPNLVTSGSYDRTVRLWNVDNGECVRVFSGHTLNVYCVLFTSAPGARFIASCGLDTSVRVWDVETGKCKATLNAHTSLVSQLVFTPTKLVSGSAEGKIAIFDTDLPGPTGQQTREKGALESADDVNIQPSRTFKIRSTPVNSLFVEDDFPFLLVGGGHGRISVVPHPTKDHGPPGNDEPGPVIGNDLSKPLTDDVEGCRFLYSNSNSPSSARARRIARIHKLAVSPDGSRCIIGGDGKGGTYIEFWAFDRHRTQTQVDVDAVNEKALMWHEMGATTPTGEPNQENVEIQAPPPPPPPPPLPLPLPLPPPPLPPPPAEEEEPAPVEPEVLPVPGAADNPQPLGNPSGGLFSY